MRVLAYLLVLMPCIACEGGMEEEQSELVADLEIGWASAAMDFVSAGDAEEAPLEYGAQGGMHLSTLPRFRGVSGIVHLEREARLVDDGTLVLRSSTQVLELPEGTEQFWWSPVFAMNNFMCPTPIGIQVFDREVEFHYMLTDRDGQLLAEDYLSVTLRCPEGESSEFCQEICSGQ